MARDVSSPHRRVRSRSLTAMLLLRGAGLAILAGLVFSGAAPGASSPGIPLDLSVAQLRARIDEGSAKVARSLSPLARTERDRSLSRYYKAMTAVCAFPGRAGEACLHDNYYNYLAHIPDSVYRVDGHVVYETGVYGLLWADDDLQQQDAERPFTWDLQVIWPRVDEPGGRSNPMWGPVAYALAGQAHARMASWAGQGWSWQLNVHLESLGRCYVSARLLSDSYGGGAHPNEEFAVFNWSRAANRPLTNADLFREDTDWRGRILALYRKRLGAVAEGLGDDDLGSSVDHGYVVTDSGITLISRWGRSRADAPLPDVALAWADLQGLLATGAPCTE